jgi:hypothetical protein
MVFMTCTFMLYSVCCVLIAWHSAFFHHIDIVVFMSNLGTVLIVSIRPFRVDRLKPKYYYKLFEPQVSYMVRLHSSSKVQDSNTYPGTRRTTQCLRL